LNPLYIELLGSVTLLLIKTTESKLSDTNHFHSAHSMTQRA